MKRILISKKEMFYLVALHIPSQINPIIHGFMRNKTCMLKLIASKKTI